MRLFKKKEEINYLLLSDEERQKLDEERDRKKRKPLFDIRGRDIDPVRKARRRKLMRTAFVIALIILFLYAPEYILDIADPVYTGYATLNAVQPDGSFIKMNTSAVRSRTEEDFDSDGLTNSDEEKYGTNMWDADSDGDGAYDVYEINISETNPNKYDDAVLIDLQTKLDESNGKEVRSPYKIGNVIVWPDDYHSRAHGSVVETGYGAYIFCDFSGYAQFPSERGRVYAYRVKDRIHTALPYLDQENAYRVMSGDLVEIYDKPLECVVEFDLFGKPLYAPSNRFTDTIADILADRGFVCAIKKARMDVEPDTSKNTVTEIRKPSYDTNNDTRFTINTNSLESLAYVWQMIANEGSCVSMSLYNDTYGEYIFIVYGYDSRGNLLVADPATLEPMGTLAVSERAKKIVDASGSIKTQQYFVFRGFGFNSAAGDRISFFAATSALEGSDFKNKEVEDKIKEEKSKEAPEEEKKENDASTEAPEGEKAAAPETESTENAKGMEDTEGIGDGQLQVQEAPDPEDPGTPGE